MLNERESEKYTMCQQQQRLEAIRGHRLTNNTEARNEKKKERPLKAIADPLFNGFSTKKAYIYYIVVVYFYIYWKQPRAHSGQK
jgi:hypothetical protein